VKLKKTDIETLILLREGNGQDPVSTAHVLERNETFSEKRELAVWWG
jgi:hypothetical protein